MDQRLIERARLAAVGQAQPLQAGRADDSFGHAADAGRGKAIGFEHDGGGTIGRAIVGDEDRLGRLRLRKEAANGEANDAGFVVRGHDDAQGGCIGGERRRALAIGDQFADLPRSE